MLENSSTPNFEEFNPWILPFHAKVIQDVEYDLDYSLGTHELLFSGSVGSGKSLLAANIIVAHALRYNGAKILIGRRSLPDLKDTLFQKIVEHLQHERFVEGKDYNINYSSAYIEFSNGSMVLGKSWADKKYNKFRSLELSMAVIEEAVENRGDDYNAIKEIRQRVGRQPHIKRNMIIYCTNPDSPSHPLYKYFFEEQSQTRHVYFSLTEQNPFLPRTYVEQLRRDLPPKEVLRMLEGKWIEIDRDRIYYAYEQEHNFIKSDYKINPSLPVSLCFDFNIALGKPMSCALGQFDEKTDSFHFFDEVVIHGGRTLTVMEEIAARGYFDQPYLFHIYGDAAGKARSTNAIHSDYDIIFDFMNKYKTKTGQPLRYDTHIPKSNPPIRERHNIVNAYCLNGEGSRRLFVYSKCEKLNDGMKLTSLKKGTQYIEDDSIESQHITTAVGYYIVNKHHNKVIHTARNL